MPRSENYEYQRKISRKTSATANAITVKIIKYAFAAPSNPQTRHRLHEKRAYNTYIQKDWMRFVWVLVGLGVLAIIAVLISMSGPRAAPSSQLPPIGFPAYAPAPRAVDVVSAQKGFNALVSFTDNGFEPSTITIKKNETIRFSNNASTALQMTSTDGTLLSGAGSIAPRNYTEITFTAAGQFQYSDIQSGTSGTVIVQ